MHDCATSNIQTNGKRLYINVFVQFQGQENLLFGDKIVLERFIAFFYIVHLPIGNIFKWWWSGNFGSHGICGCWSSKDSSNVDVHLKQFLLKKRFVPEKLQLNIAAWHSTVQSSSSEFFPDTLVCATSWDSAQFCSLLKMKRPRSDSLKRTLPEEFPNSTIQLFPHSLSMELTLGQALLALGHCRNYRVCNISLSLQPTCEELFINRASVAHSSHDISFFHSWDHFHIHSLLTS